MNVEDILTPSNIVEQMLDMLPSDIWNSKTRFLDISCKAGEFLTAIKNRLMHSRDLIQVYPDENVREYHILDNQLYGMALSAKSQQRTWQALSDYKNFNIKYTVGYVESIKTKSNDKELQDIAEKEFGIVKFDVVVGNPPYNRGMDLDFVNLGFETAEKYVCMITPAKWQTAAADQAVASKISYGEFRKKIVPHMSHVVFYPDCSDIFNIGQIDGITYYLIDKQNIVAKCRVENRSRLQLKINSVEDRSILNAETLYNIGNEINDFIKGCKKYNITNNIKETGRYEVYVNGHVSLGGGVTLG